MKGLNAKLLYMLNLLYGYNLSINIYIYIYRTKSKLNTQNGVHINDDLICCRKFLPCTFSCKKVIKP